jgi:hypothetical protein
VSVYMNGGSSSNINIMKNTMITLSNVTATNNTATNCVCQWLVLSNCPVPV